MRRSRPISLGSIRGFEATARLLNFSAAADELSLTQSAISRQIQNLESEIGQPLFIRNARTIELTVHGQQLFNTIRQFLHQIDHTVHNIRTGADRRSLSLTTFASFASMWLIPRLSLFQEQHPDFDIRVYTNDKLVDLKGEDIDIAIRYGHADTMPDGSEKLFGEQIIPMASPQLMKPEKSPLKPEDLRRFTLIEQSLGSATRFDWMNWRHWLCEQGLEKLQPKRWLYFNYTYQSIQAALDGLGVVLARPPLISDLLENRKLIEIFPGLRRKSPMAYWLLINPHKRSTPDVQLFAAWLKSQAKINQLH